MADLLPITKRCQCPTENEYGERGRRPPIYIFKAFADAIAKAGLLASSTPAQSYRCPKCKQQVIHTAGDLHLTK